MLRERILIDFGKDLKFSGGSGNSIDDSFILEKQSAFEASWTQMEILNCIFIVQNKHWRLLKRSRVDAHKHIEKFLIELKYIRGDQIITDQNNLYFDISNVDLGSNVILPDCGFNIGLKANIGLPFQIDWLHFHQYTDNEKSKAGLGVCITYRMPSTEASLYIYDRGYKNITHNDIKLLESEFILNKDDIFLYRNEVKQIREERIHNIFFADFDIGNSYSVLVLTAVNGHFFKIRASLNDWQERFKYDCLWDSLNLMVGMTKSINLN